MKPCIAFLLFAILFSIGFSQTDKASDLQLIQGLWKATSAESEGKAIDADIVKDMFIAFAGNRMIPFGEGDLTDAVYVFKLNTKRKPKQIDLSLKVKDKTITTGGIYALEGGTLKLCWDKDGGKRPTSFATPKERRVFSVVLKRETPSPD